MDEDEEVSEDEDDENVADDEQVANDEEVAEDEEIAAISDNWRLEVWRAPQAFKNFPNTFEGGRKSSSSWNRTKERLIE